MKIIKDLVCYIKEELHDANKYYVAARLADDSLRETYRWLAEQELTHVDKLHDAVARIIKNYGSEPPEVMKALWDYEHENMIAETDDLKEKLRGL